MKTLASGRMSRAARILTVAGVSLAASAAPGFAAGDLAKSGQFALRYTLFNPTTSAFGSVARGGAADQGVSGAGGWIAWLLNSDGKDGFGHKLTGKCTELYRVNSTGYDFLTGNCVYTDADGDMLYEQFDGLKGAWTGGTGKYAGLTGTLDLTDVTVTAESGYEIQSGVKVGSYEIK
jgi:hypothetical protein